MASLNEVNKALYAALCMLRDEPEKRMPSWGYLLEHKPDDKTSSAART